MVSQLGHVAPMTDLPIGLHQGLFRMPYGIGHIRDEVRPLRIVQDSALVIRCNLETFYYRAVASSTMPISSFVRPYNS